MMITANSMHSVSHLTSIRTVDVTEEGRTGLNVYPMIQGSVQHCVKDLHIPLCFSYVLQTGADRTF